MTLGAQVLVAGIGNIFLGDDAFGVEVAQRLARQPLPAGVRVVDFGIRGIDLTYALLDGDEAVILVDALPRGGAPGTLYVIEPDVTANGNPDAAEPIIDPHSMDPVKVLRLVNSMGGRSKRILLVGCEPDSLGEEEGGRMGLSAPVQGALDEAIGLVMTLAEDLLREQKGEVATCLSGT